MKKIKKRFSISHVSVVGDRDMLTKALSSTQVVSSYEAPAGVERALRTFNSDLDIRPIRHRTKERADLPTVAATRIQPTGADLRGFAVITTPTPVQRRAFELLGVSHRLGYA